MLNYIIRKAKSIENSPTIVLIHGYGSNAEDLLSFRPYLPENYNRSIEYIECSKLQGLAFFY